MLVDPTELRTTMLPSGPTLTMARLAALWPADTFTADTELDSLLAAADRKVSLAAPTAVMFTTAARTPLVGMPAWPPICTTSAPPAPIGPSVPPIPVRESATRVGVTEVKPAPLEAPNHGTLCR